MSLKFLIVFLLFALSRAGFNFAWGDFQLKTDPDSASKSVLSSDAVVARANKILAAARQAKGGEKLKNIREVSYQGTLSTFSNDRVSKTHLNITINAKGWMRSQLISFDSGNKETLIVFNGQQAWVKDETGIKESDPVEKTLPQKAAIREWFSLVLQPPEGMTMSLSMLPDLEIKGKATDTISITIGPAQFTACFDKQTHLLVKMFYDMQPAAKTIIEDYHTQYKPIRGVQLAHQFLGYAEGKKEGEITIKQYRVTPTDNPRQFIKP
jgi:hypothetical protein